MMIGKYSGGALLFAVLSLAVVPQVRAQEKAPTPPVAAAEPSAEAVSNAKRYAELVELDEVMKEMIEVMMPLAIEAEIAKRPELGPEQQAALHEAAGESGRLFSSRYADAVALKMARIFTEEELRSLVAFYESPIGRSIAAKSDALGKAGEEAAEELLPSFLEDFMQRICKRVGCDTPVEKRRVS